MTLPYVGILVNSRMYEGIHNHQTRHEHLAFYEEAPHIFGFIPCYFRIQDVDINQFRVHAYILHRGYYVRDHLQIPRVIHNRAIHLDSASYDILASWKTRGIYVFNLWNRYNKWYIHQLLLQNPSLHVYLPETLPATTSNIKKMQKKYSALIIKPNKSSVGRGIMKFTQQSQLKWSLIYPKSVSISNRIWKIKQSRHAIWKILRQRIRKRTYLVQQHIPLAEIHHRPFDLRVSVQKGKTGTWELTGIVAKLASKHPFLTNIAQGGKALALPALFEMQNQLDFHVAKERIEQCAFSIVHQLSSALPQLADVGLDIALCKNGDPKFIECNGKDQRYTFLQAGLHAEWKASYHNPMAYARYLLDSLSN